MSETLSLPGSSYEELCKIVKGYSHSGDNASLDDLAKLMGMNKSKISRNNKFLSEVSLIEGGQKNLRRHSVTNLVDH